MHHPTDRITHTTAFVTPVVNRTKNGFYITMHSTHFIYSYMMSDMVELLFNDTLSTFYLQLMSDMSEGKEMFI